MTLAFTSALLALANTAEAGEIKANVYADVNFLTTPEAPPAFALGGVDFFITSRMGDKVFLVSENLLEVGDSGPALRLKRTYIDIGGPNFKLLVGRQHMPLGYYAEAFHQAMLFHLTTQRPLVLSFKNNGGMVPGHTVGLIAHGELARNSPLPFRYDLSVGNGRSRFSNEIPSAGAQSWNKAVAGRIAVRPAAVWGMELGLSAMMDRVPAGFKDEYDEPRVPESLQELVLAAHAVYRTYPVDFIAEGYWITHTGTESGNQTTTLGGFVQLGFQHGSWTPYTRIDYLDRDSKDPFLNLSGAPENATQVRGGVRYSLRSELMLKTEYSYELESQAHRGAVQLAFGF